MRLLKVILGMILSAAPLLAAAPKSQPALLERVSGIETQEQLGEWMTYYYEHPRPDLALSSLRFLSKEGHISDGEAAFAINVFFAQVCAQTPERVPDWAQALDKETEDQRIFFARSLWLSRLPATKQVLGSMSQTGSPSFRAFVAELLKDDIVPPDFLTVELNAAPMLDAMWASFMATGNSVYAKRVLGVALLPDEKGDINRTMVVGAARWSLKANAAQHPTVLAVCREEAPKYSGDQRSFLDEVIKFGQEQK